MVDQDRFAAIRKQLSDPEPELFKFENIRDGIMGEVVRAPYQHAGKEKTLWQMVIASEDSESPVLINLTKDLIKQLVTERDVRAGDLIGIFLSEILYDKNNYRVFKVAVDPDRPRTLTGQSDPWGYDDDGNPYPDPPQDDEPPF